MSDEEWVDLYAVLGISDAAENGTAPTTKKISRAFRKLALKYHPDKQVGLTEAEKAKVAEKFERINKANQVLQDDAKRQAFQEEYSKRRQRIIRQKQLDSESRRMELELNEKERTISRNKRKAKQEKDALYHSIQIIKEQDFLFKQKFLEEEEQANLGGAQGQMDEKDTHGVSKSDRFYDNLFRTSEDAILQAALGS
mmetsp:Transcript_12909/g.23265  ORF Transcript_12909/g.23265 Transcript_12909/m.23265 type:complete len:197 (+) Transcript_12909:266-856(+)|eukprot:CAMPEP_0203752400 /NCGR_PEP_ID=MMETSP0098-20131031/6337_1 /ASSEMBLY_ACC=CAM_ASM_000208 /TAXON_ID=96639 /ORGANISM=" , Strain NY0313808BC1" /LENGTH=196 /DNA_ID=CAMNT_0050642553 /DNA_START=356 /DNA_END=946 /DNA_ORIENTATION=+